MPAVQKLENRVLRGRPTMMTARNGQSAMKSDHSFRVDKYHMPGSFSAEFSRSFSSPVKQHLNLNAPKFSRGRIDGPVRCAIERVILQQQGIACATTPGEQIAQLVETGPGAGTKRMHCHHQQSPAWLAMSREKYPCCVTGSPGLPIGHRIPLQRAESRGDASDPKRYAERQAEDFFGQHRR